MRFRSCTISIVRSALNKPSQLGHCTTIEAMVAGGGMGRAAGQTDGGGQMSIEARSSAGMRGVYPGTQIATQSFVGNDAFRLSTTAEMSKLLFAYCPVMP